MPLRLYHTTEQNEHSTFSGVTGGTTEHTAFKYLRLVIKMG